MGRGNPLFTGKDVSPSPHPTPSAKSGVFFAPVGRKKLIKLSPLNGNITFKNPNRSILYLGFDGGRSSTSRSASSFARSAMEDKATATRRKVSNPIFLLMQKKITAKRKILCGKFIFRQRIAFCRDYSRFFRKKAKKMASPTGFEPVLPG